jgi:glycosyltransferase involved in cell wall biosynthesis
LIITDDFSSDGSVVLIRKWIAMHNIECDFIAFQHNRGFPFVLNDALRLAQGKYVSIIATDDIWLPGFVEDRVGLLENCDPTYGLVYGKSFLIDEEGRNLSGLVPKSPQAPDGYVLEYLFNQNFISANTVLVRRACYEKVGQYDESLLIEDYDMWLRIAQYFKFIYSQNILSRYRIVSTSIVHSKMDQIRVSLAKIMIANLVIHPEYSKLIEKKLIDLRFELYKIGYIKTSKYVMMALAEKIKKKDLAMLLFVILGLPYSMFETFLLYRANKYRNQL